MLASCVSGGGDKDPYPEPEFDRRAYELRQEFTDLFLQGKWCWAEDVFNQAVDRYLRQDDFCGAAYTYILAWKLNGYMGNKKPELLDRAEEMRRLGLGCPQLEGDFSLAYANGKTSLTPREQKLQDLLSEKNYRSLYQRVLNDPDPLYASVYARKAARAALEDGENAWSEKFVSAAKDIDSRQGWVVFLILDWRIMARLTDDPAQKAAVKDRIEHLQSLIQPCER